MSKRLVEIEVRLKGEIDIELDEAETLEDVRKMLQQLITEPLKKVIECNIGITDITHLEAKGVNDA